MPEKEREGEKEKKRGREEGRKTIESMNEPKSCFFEKTNKIDKPLGRSTKKTKGRKL